MLREYNQVHLYKKKLNITLTLNNKISFEIIQCVSHKDPLEVKFWKQRLNCKATVATCYITLKNYVKPWGKKR